MTITGTLALFAILCASVLKRNKVQSKANEIRDKTASIEDIQVQQESYSSSSSSELSAEKSKPGPPPARGGGGVGSLGRLAGAGAADREDPAPVAAAA